MTLVPPPYPTKIPYVYRARFLFLEDGDTATMLVDRGLRRADMPSVRFEGINCPELRIVDEATGMEVDNPAGYLARAFTLAWFGPVPAPDDLNRWPFRLITTGPDKYNRWDGWVFRTRDRHCLQVDLLAAGLATEVP
jgi:endonuclease YncB( thermonuclease family)